MACRTISIWARSKEQKPSPHTSNAVTRDNEFIYLKPHVWAAFDNMLKYLNTLLMLCWELTIWSQCVLRKYNCNLRSCDQVADEFFPFTTRTMLAVKKWLHVKTISLSYLAPPKIKPPPCIKYTNGISSFPAGLYKKALTSPCDVETTS